MEPTVLDYSQRYNYELVFILMYLEIEINIAMYVYID